MKVYLFIFIHSFIIGQSVIHVLKVEGNLRPFLIEDSILANLEYLYNVNNPDKIKFSVIRLNNFPDLFKQIYKFPKNTVMAMSSISITREREKRFDFSVPYIETKESILTFHRLEGNWYDEGKKIGFVINTIEEIRANILRNKYPIQLVPFKSFQERNEGVKTQKVDYYIGESAHYWNDSGVRIIHTFENRIGLGLGIMYQKGSDLKQKLDKYIAYYRSSKGFYTTMRKMFGKDYAQYFYTDSLK